MSASSISFSKLFEIGFFHDFYADGKASSLRLIPGQHTNDMMQLSRLRLDQTLGKSSIWQGQVLGDEVVSLPDTSDPLSFLLHTDDPDFMEVTKPTWPNPQAGPDWLLYLSNQSVISDQEQPFSAYQLEVLRAARNSLSLCQSFRAGMPLQITRTWSQTLVWSGTVPSSLKVPLPALPVGKYLAVSGEASLAFCPVPNRQAGRVGLIEFSCGAVRPTDVLNSSLQFTNKVLPLEYLIRRTSPDTPLDKSVIEDALGKAAFEVVPRTETETDDVTRFRSINPVPLVEEPDPAHRFVLKIPKHNLKVPDPIALPYASARSLRTRNGQELAEVRVFL